MKILLLIRFGFFFGLGLSVAAWAAYAAAYALWPKPDCSSSERGVSRPRVSATETVEITGIAEHKTRDRVHFTGIAKNVGQSPANTVQVNVNLFKGDKFVDQYSAYLAGTIAPGESRYFKVACECGALPATEYDSYKIQVVGGY